MEGKELYQYKHENLMKAMDRAGADYVPSIVGSSCSEVAWTGQKVTDIIFEPEKYAKAMTDVFGQMWVDGNSFSGTLFTQNVENNLRPVQNLWGPDGITPEHVQLPYMEADEYDELAKDPNRFVSEILLPRKYPKLFEDREYAKKMIKIVAEDKAYCFGVLTPLVSKYMSEKYGITDIADFSVNFSNPMDTIFDNLRGFKGSLLDVRRHPDKVKKACDALWEQVNVPRFRPVNKFPYACHMTHIAPYLSPKVFREIYWPYEKQWIERQAAGGSRVWIMMEGSWARVWDLFKEVPKDSCILHVDDDEIELAKKEIGDYQIIEGGMKIVKTLTGTPESIRDETKRIIDICAPGEGFLFSTDKAWIGPKDVNQNLIDCYNFAHEYSKKG
ncbi:MAG: hypothetical protein E7240_03270 [Lachnospiraceae bacterium]|nr:hypothetical protein [Lachnospiraceae bacterium]